MTNKVQIGIVTLFPEIFQSLNYGVIGRALTQRILQVDCVNPRDFTSDKHHSVDDRPYGGGPGMVMMVEPLRDAVRQLQSRYHAKAPVIYLSPRGKRLQQQTLARAAKWPQLILVAGRYEGVDERFIDQHVDEEWSIGDYVLSGGEFAALVVIDALSRLLPGVLGHEQSACQDSFASGLLDYPHYTRPEINDSLPIPAVLQSGDHQAIEKWRHKQALGQTWLRRPELIANMRLTNIQQTLLTEFISEYGEKHD